MLIDCLRAMKAEIIREIQESWQYRTSLFTDLAVQILLYSGLLFTGKFSWLPSQYGGQSDGSRSLLLIGFVFWSYAIYALSQMGNDVAKEAAAGTLEQKFMAVVPPPLLLVAKAIGGSIISSVMVLLLIGVSALLFGVYIQLTLAAIISLGITLAGMYGLGFAFAGLAILVKRTGQIIFIIQIALLFLTGTFMPLGDLPPLVASLGRFIPLTWGIDIARRSVGGLEHITVYAWLWLAFTSSICMTFGLVTFFMAYKRARRDGLLGRY